MAEPTTRTLHWAAALVAPGAAVVAAGAMGGHTGPWWVDVSHAGGVTSLVVRARGGDAGDERLIELEAAALRAAAESAVPAPELVGADPTGVVAGLPAVVTTRLAGSSAVPPAATPARLHALGRAVARLSTTRADATWMLPRRMRPLTDVEFTIDAAGRAGPLRVAAAARLDAQPPVRSGAVLVHGDCWQGNTMWDGDEFVGFIDWDAAGTGPVGVDLSGMRLDAALYFGVESADAVTAGWVDATGRAPIDVPGWDLVAALATPPDLGEWIATIRQAGRPDLDVDTIAARRDEFTERALAAAR